MAVDAPTTAIMLEQVDRAVLARALLRARFLPGGQIVSDQGGGDGRSTTPPSETGFSLERQRRKACTIYYAAESEVARAAARGRAPAWPAARAWRSSR